METSVGFLVLLIFCVLSVQSSWNHPNGRLQGPERRYYSEPKTKSVVSMIRSSFKESGPQKPPLVPDLNVDESDDPETMNRDDSETMNRDDSETMNRDDSETMNRDDPETMNRDDEAENEDGIDVEESIDVKEEVTTSRKKIDGIVKEALLNALDVSRRLESRDIPQREAPIPYGMNSDLTGAVQQPTKPKDNAEKVPCDSKTSHPEPDSIKSSQNEVLPEKKIKSPMTTLKNEVIEATLQPEQTEEPRMENATLEEVVPELISYLNNMISGSVGGTGNYILSPFSISIALAMTYLGTRGNTAREMEETLGYSYLLGSQNLHRIHDLFHDALVNITALKKKSETLLSNGLFVQTQYEILPNYTDRIGSKYLGTIKNVDFSHDPDKAAEEINNWTSNNTRGKIPKLFEQPPEPLTIMVLANAIYFKGFWKTPFDPNITMDDKFYKTDKTTKVVPFMTLRNELFHHYTDRKLGYKFLILPYRARMSMIIALPLETEQFPTLQFSSEILSTVRRKSVKEKMVVKIPKFKISYERELTDDLRQLGIVELFSKKGADLTGISKKNDLYVSTIIHKAIIEVNEEGTEAAAATGVTFIARSNYAQPKSFIANHPFAFAIVHNPSETILFSGRVTDPS